QVAPETDVEAERESGSLDRRVRAFVGGAPYELVWLTAYRFHQRLAERFRAGRVFLAGDAAHLMAPFGARGLNSGVEDATNLAWKLAVVLEGAAPDSLLDTYDRERRAAAQENLGVTGATMRFMAPPTALHRLSRNAILRGSLRVPRLRRFVNSGKLAVPAVYEGDGLVGKPLPPEAETVDDAGHGFTVAALGGERLLVRPDGYVAAGLDGISLQAALGSALRGDPST
ncbi:MAG: FAD-dependent monooxygenase, partial [Gaiellaceae bacterium]